MAKYICTICGYVHEGDEAPAKCPQCGAPASKFKLVEENSHVARDGQYVDLVGTYNPLTEELNLDVDKAKQWIANGVQPTETVKSLLVRKEVIAPKTKA